MIFELPGKAPIIGDDCFIADTASVIGDVKIGRNAGVWFGAVVRADHGSIHIGDESNIQDNAVLHCDEGRNLVIGKRVTVGHGAVIHGCTIGDETLIGIQAVVLNGATIGTNCLVGAGSLILEDTSIPDGMLVIGSPARAVRRLTEDEIETIRDAARHYVRNAALFLESLRRRT